MNKINKIFPKLLVVSVLSLSSIGTFAQKKTDNTLPPSADKIVSPVSVLSDKKNLMAKLTTLVFFKANFIQKIFSESGELLQQGAGKLAMSKPNLVNWQTTEPSETFLISDGDTLWSYDPFIDQATAYSVAKSINNTPILLLTSNDETLWQQYSVHQSADNFVITPLKQDSQIKSLTITFLSKGFSNKEQPEQLSEFSFVDATGQISTIILTDFDAVTKLTRRCLPLTHQKMSKLLITGSH